MKNFQQNLRHRKVEAEAIHELPLPLPCFWYEGLLSQICGPLLILQTKASSRFALL